jgi:hypothetical protein
VYMHHEGDKPFLEIATDNMNAFKFVFLKRTRDKDKQSNPTDMNILPRRQTTLNRVLMGSVGLTPFKVETADYVTELLSNSTPCHLRYSQNGQYLSISR